MNKQHIWPLPENRKVRIFRCNNGRDYLVTEEGCIFCDHCTDIFYDPVYGPYLVNCSNGFNTQRGMAGLCVHFKDDPTQKLPMEAKRLC